MAFEPINTQDDLDKIIKERIERERAKFADYEALKSKVSKYESDIEAYKTKESAWEDEKTRHAKDIAEKDAEIEKYKQSETRMQVARSVGIPFEMADRISGATKEEMEKDAETLKKFITPHTAPPASSEQAEGDAKESAYRKMAQAFNKE